MHMIPAFLISLLIHLHLTALEPVIKEAVVIAKNPAVRKDIKAAVKTVYAYEKNKRQHKN
jgi:hypothetical protein